MIRLGAWQAQGSLHAREGRCAQDAAIARMAGFGGVCAVSDGCSSTPGSETAAWIWARSAAEALSSGEAGWESGKSEILAAATRRALRAADALGVRLSESLATLCLLLANAEAGEARLLVWGDGFAGRLHAGESREMGIWGAESEANAPFYPGYWLDEGAMRSWLSLPDRCSAGFAGKRLEMPKEDVARGIEERWAFGPETLLFVATDGAGSLPGIGSEAALGELAKIKGWGGDFLGRRMSRAAKEWGREGQAPGDDFSIACALRPKEDEDGDDRKA